MKPFTSAEAWRAQVDAIVRQYREALRSPDIDPAPLRQDAVAKLKALGIAEHYARRWLDPAWRSRQRRFT